MAMKRQRQPSDSYILSSPPLRNPRSAGNIRGEPYIQSAALSGEAQSPSRSGTSFESSGEELFTTYGSSGGEASNTLSDSWDFIPGKTTRPLQQQPPAHRKSTVFPSQETSMDEPCVSHSRTRYSNNSTTDLLSPSSMYPEQGSTSETSSFRTSTPRKFYSGIPLQPPPAVRRPSPTSKRDVSLLHTSQYSFGKSRQDYSTICSPQLSTTSPSHSRRSSRSSGEEDFSTIDVSEEFSNSLSDSWVYRPGEAKTPLQKGSPRQTPTSPISLGPTDNRWRESYTTTSPSHSRRSSRSSGEDFATFDVSEEFSNTLSDSWVYRPGEAKTPLQKGSPRQTPTSLISLGPTENRWTQSYTTTSPSHSRRSSRSSGEDVATFDVSEEFSNTLSDSWVYSPGAAKSPLQEGSPPKTPPSRSLHEFEDKRPKRKISFRYSMLSPNLHTAPPAQTHQQTWQEPGVGGTQQRRRLSVNVSELPEATPWRQIKYSDPGSPTRHARFANSPARRLTQRQIKSPCCNLEAEHFGISPIYKPNQTYENAGSAFNYHSTRSPNTNLPADYYIANATEAKSATRPRFQHDKGFRKNGTADSAHFQLATEQSKQRMPHSVAPPSGHISHTHNLTSSTYNSFLKQQQLVVVMFVNSAVSRPPHAGAWGQQNVLRAPKGSSQTFASVDCATEQELCAREGIRTHPFYKVYYGGYLVNAVKDFDMLTFARQKHANGHTAAPVYT